MPNLSRDGSCCEDDCDKPILARQMCRAHYAAWYRRQRQTPPCKIDGCSKASIARGWCPMHYWRWKKNGDPLISHRKRVDMTQTKACQLCGENFGPTPGCSHDQWASRQFCGPSCASVWKAHGGLPAFGALSKRALGKPAYDLAYQHRRAMPRWAAWWEDRRQAEDMADLVRPAKPGPRCRLSRAPKPRHFTACWCSGCGVSFVADAGRFQGSTRCSDCTKRYWRGNHERRARRYGATYELIVHQEVFESDRWVCQLCGVRTFKRHGHSRSATLDHITPFAKGGNHTRDNVQTACARCNFSKGAGTANDQLRLAV